jgi:DNA polymerase III psi subunit
MMNRQDFFIQQLGIGPIWKLNEGETKNFASITSTLSQSMIPREIDSTHVSNKLAVDMLVLRLNQQENQQIKQQADMLFERILQAFQLNSQMSVIVQNMNESISQNELENAIQTTSTKLLAVFGVEIVKKLLNVNEYLIDDSLPMQSIMFNQHPMFVFHTPEELLNNALLKKSTWEKMSMLKSSLH